MPSGAGGVPHAITVPGFSSRSQTSVFTQFPQRDGADMSDMQPEAGFSNSEPVEDAPQDNHPEVSPPEEPDPGFSNSKAVRNDEADEAPATEPADADEAADEKPAKKAAAKKSTAKKKG